MTGLSEQIKRNPIGNGLDDVRSTFESVCTREKTPYSTDSVDQLGQEDLRNLTLPLLVALQSHILSISLPSTSGCGSLQNDLLRLISAAVSDSFDFNRVKPLLKAAFSSKLDDATIWDQA
ncbi:hypothetical protein CABS03_15147 [Colletotrichum abscissum]